MKITILTENLAGGRFLAEHGLSYLIEHKGEKLLFDMGHSDVFLHNSELLGVDIHKDVDTLVLSHGHWDHGDGLQYLEGKKLFAHPLVFMQRYRRMDKTYLGLKMSKSEAVKRFDLQTSISPIEVKLGIIFLGEIPRHNDFEAKKTPFLDSKGEPDFILDDSALAIVDGDELVVVSGCAHSGICNIVNYAMTVTGIRNVKAVVGGFHLKKNDEIARMTVDCLKAMGVKSIYPSHCTDFPALVAFNAEFDIKQLKTGMVLDL